MDSIEVKDSKILKALLCKHYHPILNRLMIWIIQEFHSVCITEAFRHQRHSNDLHGTIPVRAIDLRSWIYISPQEVADRINEVWQYDPTRPNMECCVYHDSGSGPHFHIQVHPKTIQVQENT